ncbi:hypothetical protein ACOMHN_027173 [Nucella lapillus]
MVRVAVVGAGMVGLATAVNVQEALPWARVTLLADQFDLDTTSSGAGGIFEPTVQAWPNQDPDTLREWSRQSWNYFTGLAMSPLGRETGHSLVSGYMLADNREAIENPAYADIVFNFRVLKPEELRKLNFAGKYGNTFTTVITQTKKFMPWLMRKFRERGGIVESRTISSLEELAGAYDIVMNCAGMRAGQLANDSTMYPIKGQMVQIKAPWIKQFVYWIDKKRPTYFIPHDDKVWVGGTKDERDYSTHLDPEIEEDILKRAGDLLPQIKAGDIVGRWAGLRPQRSSMRVEKELVNVNGKKLRVVHNYGHGANGISLSWGTSLRAAQLATEWANEISRSSRL